MNPGTVRRTVRTLARNLAHPVRLANILRGRLSRPAPGGRVSWLPYSLDVEPTLRCNLRCPMCVHTHWSRAAPDMTPDGFRRLLDGVPTLVKVKLQGVGEPFLSPHFFDLVEEATRRDIAPHTITNGTTLSERVVERIYASGLVEVAVSLDTPRKESFERIRAGADFDRVLAGVRRLCGHGLRRRLLVSVWATIWRDTVAETPELVRLAADLGVDSLFLNFSLWDWNDPGAARAVAGARPVGDDIYRESARRSREEAARSGLALVVLPPGAGAARSSILRCEWPWRSAFVTCDGHVTPCCKIARPADCSLGNAFTTPFRAIWNGPRYRAFRAAFLRGEPPAVCDAACSAGG